MKSKMAIRTFIFSTLLTSCFIMHGQIKEIYFYTVPEYSSETVFYSGIVTKITDNSPVDSVEIYAEGFGIVGYTNNEGLFKLKAPANISKLFFKKNHYIGMSIVFIGDNERKNNLSIKIFPEKPNEKEQELIQKKYSLCISIDSSDLLKEDTPFKTTDVTEVPATIRVLMADNTVVVMNMDEYLKGVVPSEVPPGWDMDALKSQAVAARSYASANFKHNSEGADVCTTTHCQAWNSTHYDKTDQAVIETSRMSVKYEGTIINALFFSHCDGNTRNNEDVWGGTPVPYLRSKSCPCGYTFHNAHGVGMCQYGSSSMANTGSTWESILTYYYTGTYIDKPITDTFGTLTGVIYYGSDNNLDSRIAGATVKLNTGQQVTSGEYGLYMFDIAPGTYTVTASKEGFESASVTREVKSGNTIWGSIQLSPIVELTEVTTQKNIFIQIRQKKL